MTTERIKVRQAVTFEKDNEAFAILFNKPGDWGTGAALEGANEPILFVDEHDALVSICWEMPFTSVLANKATGKLDMSLINRAEKAASVVEVSLPARLFAFKSAYYPDVDAVLAAGNEKPDKAINLGQGVYALMSGANLTGIVLTSAKKKYEQAR